MTPGPERGISLDELNFRASADTEDAREAAKERKRQHRRSDKKRGTVVSRATRKVVDATVPPGSKRRQLAYGASATALSAAAIYEGSRAVNFVGETGARVVMKGSEIAGDVAGTVLGEGEDNPEADYAADGVSQSDVEAAQADEAAGQRLSDAAAEHEAGSGN